METEGTEEGMAGHISARGARTYFPMEPTIHTLSKWPQGQHRGQARVTLQARMLTLGLFLPSINFLRCLTQTVPAKQLSRHWNKSLVLFHSTHLHAAPRLGPTLQSWIWPSPCPQGAHNLVRRHKICNINTLKYIKVRWDVFAKQAHKRGI